MGKWQRQCMCATIMALHVLALAWVAVLVGMLLGLNGVKHVYALLYVVALIIFAFVFLSEIAAAYADEWGFGSPWRHALRGWFSLETRSFYQQEAIIGKRTWSEHHLRTPLSTIIGMNELLLLTELTPEQLALSQAIQQSGNALLSAINGQENSADAVTTCSILVSAPPCIPYIRNRNSAISDSLHSGRMVRADLPAVEEASASPLILVVEDNALLQKLAARQLQVLGADVLLVDDGSAAVEIRPVRAFDLILMDINLPVVNGKDAARAIRKLEAALQLPRVPIVAVTAGMAEGDRIACLNAGMDDYWRKPVRMDDLRRILQTWVRSPALPPKQ